MQQICCVVNITVALGIVAGLATAVRVATRAHERSRRGTRGIHADIGYMLLKAMEANEPTTIMALALLLIVFATSASWILLAIDSRLHRRT